MEKVNLDDPLIKILLAGMKEAIAVADKASIELNKPILGPAGAGAIGAVAIHLAMETNDHPLFRQIMEQVDPQRLDAHMHSFNASLRHHNMLEVP